ncbi:unnamed protein product [Rotaria magnacalcarata]|uniref:Tektin n=9 Tax=Rotaria magnacalcarata TaxID=392030 RepID=A0A816Z312_9BILA|nr:unnamed protein product [Rotaria magnacalcarata]CAF1482156.1 unnamed protein product [Rotaria magnacalcarata]CAF2182718.1 unnamed protein product [Rotaria magnacalcarata]
MDSKVTAQSTRMSRRSQQGSILPSIGIFDNRTSSTSPYSNILTRSLSISRYPTVYYRTAHIEPTQSLDVSIPQPFSSTNDLNNIDSAKMPSICLSGRPALYVRYTPKDWHDAQTTNYLTSDKILAESERLRSDAIRLAHTKDEQAIKNNFESSKCLAESIKNIEYWKNELEKTEDKMARKIDDVQFKRRELERVLSEIENPLRITQENLYEREKRQGIDLVHDNAERELIREVDRIQLSQDNLRKMLECLSIQNARNHASLHELERDLKDKYRARALDSAAHDIETKSRGINFYEDIEFVDNTVSVPESWAQYTKENIYRALNEISQSDELLNASKQLMTTIYHDMWSQWNHTNISLENRVQEEQAAKNEIQAHLEKILQEIFDVKQNIEFLKKTIADHEAFLQVAQTRLATRARRPNIEACRDPAMHRLIQEVHDLHAAIADLLRKLRQEENAVQHLLRSKSSLEQDLTIKKNSLFIDSEKVLGIRRLFMMDAREKSSLPSVSCSQSHDLINV